VKLWLDDIRDPIRWKRSGWTWARTPNEAKDLLLTARANGVEVTALSLDHDLGGEIKDPESLPPGPLTMRGRLHYPSGHDPEGTGYDFAVWVAENNLWPTGRFLAHSASDEGAKRILSVARRKFPEAPWTHIGGKLREEQFR